MGVARGRCRATGVVAGVLACVLAVAPSASADPSSVAGGASECVPDRSTIAQCFPDKALAQAIAKQVKGDAGKTGEVLTSKDVKGVSYLDFSNSQVASVQGLQVFANLGSMYLFGTRVSDVSPLAGLTKLTALYLSDTKVSDATLPSIAKLPNLQWLDLSGTQVSNVSPLAKMTKLEYLNLSGTQVSNVSPLAKMTKLEYLNLSGTQVSNVSPLAKLMKLSELDLANTKVSDVSPLAKLTKLVHLDLSGTGVLDLGVLHGLSLNNSCEPSVCATSFAGVRPSVKLAVDGDGSVSMPAPRWLDGTVVASSSTSPAGATLDAKRGVVTWKKYDAGASYSYDFKQSFTLKTDGLAVEFSGHVSGVKPTTPSKPTTPGKPTTPSKPTTPVKPTTPSKPAVSTVTMYRLYNRFTGEHFYTSSSVERDSLVKVGWRSEGTGWVAPVSGAPVYRLYNPYVAGGDHHYTMSVRERDALVKAGWRSEGIGWYSGGSVRVLREYNPYARTGTHNYTTDAKEDTALVKAGWRAEGTGWYAVKAK
ncbi:hypothetical protein D805_0400 [Bifidobacterium thermophilum RBL67]|uniref:DUF5648 domain-containing protein n=3 Tax=Bifidobacterium thermophilum TaxID=33905 RepID=M4RQ59_9BIFI|nr:leucine-rich repeat domain-containing protein [Bifidobacterium thermophilum]AGH40667.1 hypothetical protein D805_0400 [Bifidobacterium thermophilum RBL67]